MSDDVPIGVVGVVRGADRIDVEALHQLDVLDHALFGNDVPRRHVVLVPVHAADDDGLAVDGELPVGDLDLHVAR